MWLQFGLVELSDVIRNLLIKGAFVLFKLKLFATNFLSDFALSTHDALAQMIQPTPKASAI